MKTIKKFSIFAIAGLFMTSCAGNDVTEDNKQDNKEQAQGTTFIGGISLKFNETPATRTSLSVTLPGGSTVDYFWEKGDKIWTADNANGEAQITTTAPTALFHLSKAYTTPTIELYYPGKNATKYNEVTIAANQTQTEPNSTKHIGEAGDCGTATAHQLPDRSYQFNLNHQASYLCLLPRSSNACINNSVITKIEITADKNIAGTYTLTSLGLVGAGNSKTITLTTGNFPLTNTTTNQGLNAAYVVIAPGSYNMTIRYWLKNSTDCPRGEIEGTITKKVSGTYTANNVYPITAKLDPTDYPGNNYGMWDAGNQYWFGYESELPHTYNEPRGTHYPQVGDVYDRYTSSVSGETQATKGCKDCPNINELLWYVCEGTPHIDNDELWTTMGHLYKGGAWIKKKSVIRAETGATDAAMKAGHLDKNGVTRDFRKKPSIFDYRFYFPPFPSQPKYRPENTDDYFYLPMLSYYHRFGGLGYEIGEYGWYWSSSSTPDPSNNYNAILLYVGNQGVFINDLNRDCGGIVAPTWFQ